MGFKINAQNLSQKPKLELSDFRKMVNYDSGKNKGYVRLCRQADGKIGIQKVNNKLDIGISGRMNVTAQNNQYLRDQLFAAFKLALAGTQKDRDVACENIARELGIGSGKTTEKPLSRREIRNAFKAFDQVMNDDCSRKKLVRNVVETAIYESGFVKSGEKITSKQESDFVLRYMGQSYEDVLKADELKKDTAAYNKEWRASEKLKETDYETGYDTRGAKRHMPMLKDDITFKKFMSDLECRAKQGVSKFRNENIIRLALTTRGGKLDGADTAMIKQYLGERLLANGINPAKDLGTFGTGDAIMKAFMDKVLPAIIQDAADQFKQLSSECDTDEKKANLADSILSLDNLTDHAVRFFKEYESLITEVNDGKGDILLQLCSFVKDQTEAALAKIKLIEFKKNLQEFTRTRTTEVESIVKDAAMSFAGIKAEEKLDLFARNYVAKHVRDEAADAISVPSFAERVDDTLDNVTLAAMAANGRKAVGMADAAALKHRGLKGSEFFNKADDLLAKELQKEGLGGNLQAHVDISETFLAETMNFKIEEAKKQSAIGTAAMDTKMTTADLDAKKLGLPRAIDVYKKGMAECAAQLKKAGKILNSFLHFLEKNNGLNKAQSQEIADRLPGVLRGCVRQEIRELLATLPGRSSDYDPKDDVKKAVSAGVEQALNTLKDLAATSVVKEKLDRSDRIRLDNRKGAVDSFLAGQANLDYEREKIQPALERLFDAIQLDTLKDIAKMGGVPDRKKVDEAIKKMFASFEEKASVLLEKVGSLRSSAKDAVRGNTAGTLKELIADRSAASWMLVYGGEDVSGEEREQLVKTLTDTIVNNAKDNFEKTFEVVYKNPNAYNERIVGQMAIDEVLNRNTMADPGKQLGMLRDECDKKVTAWLGENQGTSGKSGKTPLMDTLTASVTSLREGVKTHVISDDFGAHLAQLDTWAFERLLSAAKESVTARAKKLPLLYAMGNEESFKTRLDQELKKELARLVGVYEKAWDKLGMNSKDLSAPYQALGEEAIGRIRRETLVGVALSSDPKLQTSRNIERFFVRKLQAALNLNLTIQQQSFESYLAEVEKAEKNLPLAKERIVSSFKDNFSLYSFPKEIVQHFEKSVESKLDGILRDMLTADPGKFIGEADDEASAFSTTLDSLLGRTAGIISGVGRYNLSEPSSIDDLLWECGYVEYVSDDGKKANRKSLNGLRNAIRDLAATGSIQTELPGKLEAIFDDLFEKAFPPIAKTDAAEKGEMARDYIRNAVHTVCNPTIGMLQLAEFNDLSYPDAKKAFDVFLDSYEKLQNRSENVLGTADVGGGLTVRDMADMLFLNQYNKVANAIATDPDGEQAQEPLLSVNFLVELQALYGTMGVNVMLTDTLKNISGAAFDEALNDDKSLAGMVNAKGAEPDSACHAALEKNAAELKALFSEVIAQTHGEVRLSEEAQTLEGFLKSEDGIGKKLSANLATRLETFKMKCSMRISLAQRFDAAKNKILDDVCRTIDGLAGRVEGGPELTGEAKTVHDKLLSLLEERVSDLRKSNDEALDRDIVTGDEIADKQTEVENFLNACLQDLTSPTSKNEFAQTYQNFVANCRGRKVAEDRSTWAETAVENPELTGLGGLKKDDAKLFVEKIYDYSLRANGFDPTKGVVFSGGEWQYLDERNFAVGKHTADFDKRTIALLKQLNPVGGGKQKSEVGLTSVKFVQTSVAFQAKTAEWQSKVMQELFRNFTTWNEATFADAANQLATSVLQLQQAFDDYMIEKMLEAPTSQKRNPNPADVENYAQNFVKEMSNPKSKLLAKYMGRIEAFQHFQSMAYVKFPGQK